MMAFVFDDAGQHPYRDHRDNREFLLAPFRQSCTICPGSQGGLLDYVTNLYTLPPHGGLEAEFWPRDRAGLILALGDEGRTGCESLGLFEKEQVPIA
jgi:hypothetical protein